MLGIIAAMEEELEAVLAFMKGADRVEKCGRVFYTDGRAVAALSGIGKVNAALCAQTMILAFGADAILNIGSAGGLKEGMKPGDLVIATQVAQHDLFVFDDQFDICDCDKAMADRAASLAKGPVYRGVIASGDHFVEKKEEKEKLQGKLNAVACDMEAASVGRACRMAGVPFAIVRGISDGADEDARASFEECLKLASARAADVAIAYIQSVLC